MLALITVPNTLEILTGIEYRNVDALIARPSKPLDRFPPEEIEGPFVARRSVRIQTRVDPYGNEDVPKTRAGIRTIPLGEGVLAALKAWRSRTPFAEDNDLVFPNYCGRYTDHRNMMLRSFEPLFHRLAAQWETKRRNEPLEWFSWHALRHFAISCWIEAGLPPKTIQTFAGHSSLQVTMDRYGHLFPSDDHGRAMDAIAGEIGAPARPPKARSRKGARGPAV